MSDEKPAQVDGPHTPITCESLQSATVQHQVRLYNRRQKLVDGTLISNLNLVIKHLPHVSLYGGFQKSRHPFFRGNSHACNSFHEKIVDKS